MEEEDSRAVGVAQVFLSTSTLNRTTFLESHNSEPVEAGRGLEKQSAVDSSFGYILAGSPTPLVF